jgi:hypothetical protein
MVSFLLLKIKLLLYNNFLFKFYLNFIQFFFIKILFNILYILHIDEFFRIFKGFNILNKLKYKEDPLFFRNYFLKIPLNFYNLYMNCKNNLINYNLYDNINYFINLFLIFIFQIVYKFNLYDKYSYLYNFFLKKIILIFFLKKNYINKNILNKKIFILLYFLNFIIINIIYLILNFIFFLIYAILYNCIKLKK